MYTSIPVLKTAAFFIECRFAFSFTSQRKQVDPKDTLLFFRLIVLIYCRFYRHGMPRSQEISRLSSAQMKPTVWYFLTVEFDRLEWVFYFSLYISLFCQHAEMIEKSLMRLFLSRNLWNTPTQIDLNHSANS